MKQGIVVNSKDLKLHAKCKQWLLKKEGNENADINFREVVSYLCEIIKDNDRQSFIDSDRISDDELECYE